MVADRVSVETRRADEEQGWRWTSSGDGSYEIEPAEGLGRGTIVSLHLREPAEAEEEADKSPRRFLEEWVLRDVVRRYSDFVEYPVQMEVTRSAPKLDDEGKPIEGESEETTELATLNSQKPLWSRAKSEITDEEHAEFLSPPDPRLGVAADAAALQRGGDARVHGAPLPAVEGALRPLRSEQS